MIIEILLLINLNYYICIIENMGIAVTKQCPMYEVETSLFEVFRNHYCFKDPDTRNNCALSDSLSFFLQTNKRAKM